MQEQVNAGGVEMEERAAVEKLKSKIAEMRKAQQIFSAYSQEQVDKICYAVAKAAIQNRVSMARMAVKETQMGILEDKILKNHYAAEFVYDKYRHTKTCGVIETDEEKGLQKIAAPVGLVGAVLPMTNPTSSAIFQILLCMKTRNAVLISPHPQAKDCTCAAVQVCAQAAYEAGAPEGIIDCLKEPTMELASEMMKLVDFVLATGGAEVIRSAYASGKPAIGAGSGNCPVIIHESANIRSAVCAILQSKAFDAGLLCSSEQAVIVVGGENMTQAKKEFQKLGGYLLNQEECAAVRTLILTSYGKTIGKKARFIAQSAGIEVPAETKVLIAQVTEISQAEPFAQEKLCPILALYQAESYFQALDMAEQLLQLGGSGHTAGIYIDPKEEKDLALWRDRMKACRLLVNGPTAQGGIGGISTELPPALMLGCGTWGGSSLAGNLEPRHLLNVKTVAFQRSAPMALQMPQAIYCEAGCTGTALSELWEQYHYQRVFLLTDHYLYQTGRAALVLSKLERMEVLYAAYYDITPNLTIEQIQKGLAAVEQFQPDVIIGMGGGTALNAAKVMRYQYEHFDVSWEDLQGDFLDGRKRVLEAKKSGKKTLLFTIVTTVGAGTAGTPYAMVTDEKTGIISSVYHSELLPNATIIDTKQMQPMPKELIRTGGMSTLACVMESFLSLRATDYTDGFALFSCRNVLKYLPRAYAAEEPDEVGQEKLVSALGLADIAMTNTSQGLIHGMACALSSWHHLPYGVACGILLPEVMRYHQENKLNKRNVFFTHPYPDLARRYEALARFCGFAGFQHLYNAVRQLQNKVEIYPTIQAYGVEEAYFLDTLERMAEVAWKNQRMMDSPVFPQIEEIRDLYLRCYYGASWENKRME